MSQPPPIVDLPSDHRSARGGARVAAVVIHATAGTDSRAWLQQNPRGVSAHVLIARDGVCYRMVPDDLAAHHCGHSRIVVGGRVITRDTQPTPNQVTLGVELENRNDGREPYPAAQLAALGWLLASWARAFPAARLLFHREIDTQGKTDPAGLDWPTVYAAMAPWLVASEAPLPPSPQPYTADSPLMAVYAGDAAALIATFARRCARSAHYAPDDCLAIGGWYAQACAPLGLDLAVVLAQVCHETGNLTSWWSQRPRRNPAGIGVTGDAGKGLRFASWATESIPAHVGRLVAYATRPDARTPAQQAAVDVALAFRPLPPACQGSAPTLRQLGVAANPAAGCGWASPGDGYGAALGRIAAALVADALMRAPTTTTTGAMPVDVPGDYDDYDPGGR